nr:zinc finger, CCHC-type [Tanacetum cinerariifolium]
MAFSPYTRALWLLSLFNVGPRECAPRSRLLGSPIFRRMLNYVRPVFLELPTSFKYVCLINQDTNLWFIPPKKTVSPTCEDTLAALVKEPVNKKKRTKRVECEEVVRSHVNEQLQIVCWDPLANQHREPDKKKRKIPPKVDCGLAVKNEVTEPLQKFITNEMNIIDLKFCVKDVRCLLDDVFLPKAEVPTRWIKSIPIGAKSKGVLEGVFYISWWSICNFRNLLLFEVKKPRKDVIFDDIVLRSFNWCVARGDFELWRVKMHVLSIQHGCEAPPEVLPTYMKVEAKAELKKAPSVVILCLSNKVLREVIGEMTTTGVWTKLDTEEEVVYILHVSSTKDFQAYR